jgi:hypothetical protein
MRLTGYIIVTKEQIRSREKITNGGNHFYVLLLPGTNNKKLLQFF